MRSSALFRASKLLCLGAGELTTGKFGTEQLRIMWKSPFAGVCEGNWKRGGVIEVVACDGSELCFLCPVLADFKQSILLWDAVLMSHLRN